MNPKKMRVITRGQIDAMIDAAVTAALEEQKQQLAQQRGHVQRLEATETRYRELEMERDQERRRRHEAEATEDNLRAKIRDLEQALKVRKELLEEETRKAFEFGRAEGEEDIARLRAEVEALRGKVLGEARRADAAPDVKQWMEQMQKSISEEIGRRFEETRRRREADAIREKDVVLDSLFKERLETNEAQMNVRTSVGPGISGALAKLRSFHDGRDNLEIHGDERDQRA